MNEFGRIWSRWPLKILNRVKKIEKPSRPEKRRSAIVPKTRWSYCERNCRTAIVLRTLCDRVAVRSTISKRPCPFLTRSSRPKIYITQSHYVLSPSLLSLILIKSKQIVPNTFLHSPKRLQYVRSTPHPCSVRVVAFVSSPFNENSVCSTIKSGGYKYGPSSHRII